MKTIENSPKTISLMLLVVIFLCLFQIRDYIYDRAFWILTSSIFVIFAQFRLLYFFIKGRRRQKFLFLFLNFFFYFVEAEIALQIFYQPPERKAGWRGCSGGTCNELGFRGHPLQYEKADYKIVLLGDSQVEAMACSDPEQPERKLEAILNRWNPRKDRPFKVSSIGTAGYGQDQELLALQEYFMRYQADAVVLWFTPQNDLWNNIFPTHWPANGHPKPTYWMLDHKLEGPSERIGESLSHQFRLITLLQFAYYHQDRDGYWERNYLRGHPPYSPWEESGAEALEDWQNLWNKNINMMRDENLGNEKSHFSIYLSPRSPRMAYGIELTRALLQQIELLSRENHASFMIFKTDQRLVERNIGFDERVHRLNGKGYKTSFEQYKKNIHDLFDGYSFQDLPVTVADWSVSPTDPHLNAQANEQVMGELAHHLLSSMGR